VLEQIVHDRCAGGGGSERLDRAAAPKYGLEAVAFED